MYKIKKKNTAITVIIIAVALALVLGVVGVLSSGFQNMDARDWVNGYKNNLKISTKVNAYNSDIGEDGMPAGAVDDSFVWTMEGKTTIVSPEEIETEFERSIVDLYNFDDEVYVGDDKFTLTSTISLVDNDTSYGQVGYIFDACPAEVSSQGYKAHAIFIEYDSEEECMRVSFGNVDYGKTYAQQSTVWHDLSWYGIYNLNNVKFNFTYTITDDGLEIDVTVGNKTVKPYGTDNDTYFLANEDMSDDSSNLLDYSEAQLKAFVTGTQAKFIDVQVK